MQTIVEVQNAHVENKGEHVLLPYKENLVNNDFGGPGVSCFVVCLGFFTVVK